MLTFDDSPIRQAVHEVRRHVSEDGWDQSPRLFALVRTGDILRDQPEMAGELGPADSFTAVEQEDLHFSGSFEDLLASIEWPDSVHGCAVAIERVMLPPEAEADLPDDPAELAEVAASHPDRREVRIVTGVLRDGSTHTTIEARDSTDSEVLEGTDLVPGLVELVRGTLA